MSTENYYRLLGVEPSASEDEVKRAFRQQITRYHPDKVQHLGKEFQALAATRAAELTTAYTALSDAGRRADYDRACQLAVHAPEPPPMTATPGRSPATSQFVHERAVRDEFVRQAAMGQLRQGLSSVSAGMYNEAVVAGFDLAATPKARLFRKTADPAVLGRFVGCVDSRALADAWDQAGKWAAGVNAGVCVLLIGSSIAPAHELAAAIAAQRRKGRAAHVTVIAMHASDWKAHVPTDAPALAKRLIAHLQRGVRR